MSSRPLLERLTEHRIIGTVPPAEIAWVASHGVLRPFDTGAILTPKDGHVDGLNIVLSGHLSIYVETGTGRRKVMEWRGGDVTGVLPYSRIVSPPGNVAAEEPSEVVTVYRKDMPEMIRECHQLTTVLVHVMLDRARHFTSSFLHDEKLVSLGKLSAGLAHELNNPAAAIARAAAALPGGLEVFQQASQFMGAVELTAVQRTALAKAREECLVQGVKHFESPLAREEREDALSGWLETHGLATYQVEAMADSGITVDRLDTLAQSLAHADLNVAVQWLASGCAVEHLAVEIREAAARISELVTAVKGFTQMDRAAVPEPVDLGRGLADTLTVLKSKARAESVSLSLQVSDGLPKVRGFGGELNQVWTNLIENAIDAAGEGGRIEVSAAFEKNSVVVRVVDSGPGIPEEIRSRIFDPFFTTKPVGKGTGLGLDIVRRLVQRHNGQIELESSPGRTEFRVTLPVIEV